MNLISLFFLLNVLAWIPYSLVCLAAPELLSGGIVEELVVFDQDSWITKVEVRAMYGGAQLAIGVFALAALFNAKHRPSALLFFVLLFAGLAFTRAAGLLMDGPGLYFKFSGNFGAVFYNSGALWAFEAPMLVFALFLLLRQSNK